METKASLKNGRVENKKQIRNNTVINLLRRHKTMSRIEISQATGYSPMTASQIADELIEEGIALEVGKGESKGGRRPVMLELAPDAGFIVGVQFGQHQVFSILANLSVKILYEVEELSYIDEPPPEIARRLCALINRMLGGEDKRLRRLKGIAMAVPGITDNQGLGPRHEPSCFLPVMEELARRFDVPVYLDNTASMKAIGEKWFGRARDYRNFYTINMGYSTSSSLFLDNKIYRGGYGHPGGLGHMKFQSNDQPCFCGGVGCLENDIGGLALERKGIAYAQKHPRSGLAKLVSGDFNQINARLLAEAARAGDAGAREPFLQLASTLGLAIASIFNLLNVEAVILTGRLTKAADLFLDPLNETVQANINPVLRKEFHELQVSTLLDRGAALGACAVVLERVYGSNYEEVVRFV